MVFERDGASTLHPTMNIAVVASEATGFDPGKDQVFALGMLCVKVDSVRGRFIDVIGTAVDWQRPTKVTAVAPRGTHDHLHGCTECQFDRQKIDALLAQTDLVVAHNAVWERTFLKPVFPAFGRLPWACSLAEIDWRDGQKVPYPSIAMLLRAYRLEPHDITPQGNCEALVQILSKPLLESWETGFRRLIAASARVTVEYCVTDGDTDSRAALEALGFARRGNRLTASKPDAAAATELRTRVTTLTASNPNLRLDQAFVIDAVGRFSLPSPPRS